MTPRSLLILGVVAVATIAGALWSSNSRHSTEHGAGQPLYASLKEQMTTADAVRIFKSGDTPAVELKRK